MLSILRFFPFTEFTLSCTRFFATLRMTKSEGLRVRMTGGEGLAMTKGRLRMTGQEDSWSRW